MGRDNAIIAAQINGFIHGCTPSLFRPGLMCTRLHRPTPQGTE
jgi:hypothetical protein